jgi:hypothetical protein
MKSDQNRQDFTQAKAARSLAVSLAIGEKLLLPLGLKGLAEVIDRAKQGF